MVCTVSICALIWRIYEFYDISAHTVVMSRETVKYPKNTICDTSTLKSRRYEFSEISTHTVGISGEAVE